jgi:hypothetical protein
LATTAQCAAHRLQQSYGGDKLLKQFKGNFSYKSIAFRQQKSATTAEIKTK